MKFRVIKFFVVVWILAFGTGITNAQGSVKIYNDIYLTEQYEFTINPHESDAGSRYAKVLWSYSIDDRSKNLEGDKFIYEVRNLDNDKAYSEDYYMRERRNYKGFSDVEELPEGKYIISVFTKDMELLGTSKEFVVKKENLHKQSFDSRNYQTGRQVMPNK